MLGSYEIAVYTRLHGIPGIPKLEDVCIKYHEVGHMPDQQGKSLLKYRL